MSTQQLKNKIDLLEKYVQSLEKQNQAKNIQTALLYTKNDELNKENQQLRQQFNGLKILYEERSKDQIDHLQKIQILKNHNIQLESKLDDIENQMNGFMELKSVKNQNQQLIEQLKDKNKQVDSLTNKNKELLKLILKYQKDFEVMQSKIQETEQRKKKYAKRIKQLQQTNNELKHALQSTNNYTQSSFSKIDLEKLIKDNNGLIEKVRLLEKQKNYYYEELKSISPLRQRRILPDESRRKTMNAKTQHWSQMQQKINAIKSQNEQLKANLIIR